VKKLLTSIFISVFLLSCSKQHVDVVEKEKPPVKEHVSAQLLSSQFSYGSTNIKSINELIKNTDGNFDYGQFWSLLLYNDQAIEVKPWLTHFYQEKVDDKFQFLPTCDGSQVSQKTQEWINSFYSYFAALTANLLKKNDPTLWSQANQSLEILLKVAHDCFDPILDYSIIEFNNSNSIFNTQKIAKSIFHLPTLVDGDNNKQYANQLYIKYLELISLNKLTFKDIPINSLIFNDQMKWLSLIDFVKENKNAISSNRDIQRLSYILSDQSNQEELNQVIKVDKLIYELFLIYGKELVISDVITQQNVSLSLILKEMTHSENQLRKSLMTEIKKNCETPLHKEFIRDSIVKLNTMNTSSFSFLQDAHREVSFFNNLKENCSLENGEGEPITLYSYFENKNENLNYLIFLNSFSNYFPSNYSNFIINEFNEYSKTHFDEFIKNNENITNLLKHYNRASETNNSTAILSVINALDLDSAKSLSTQLKTLLDSNNANWNSVFKELFTTNKNLIVSEEANDRIALLLEFKDILSNINKNKDLDKIKLVTDLFLENKTSNDSQELDLTKTLSFLSDDNLKLTISEMLFQRRTKNATINKAFLDVLIANNQDSPLHLVFNKEENRVNFVEGLEAKDQSLILVNLTFSKANISSLALVINSLEEFTLINDKFLNVLKPEKSMLLLDLLNALVERGSGPIHDYINLTYNKWEDLENLYSANFEDKLDYFTEFFNIFRNNKVLTNSDFNSFNTDLRVWYFLTNTNLKLEKDEIENWAKDQMAKTSLDESAKSFFLYRNYLDYKKNKANRKISKNNIFCKQINQKLNTRLILTNPPVDTLSNSYGCRDFGNSYIKNLGHDFKASPFKLIFLKYENRLMITTEKTYYIIKVTKNYTATN